MGFDRPVRFRAHFQKLAARHAEHYASADEVRSDVEFVLRRPDDWFPHAGGRITFVRASRVTQDIPAVRVDFLQEADGTFHIVSVYRMTKRSVVGKMREKRREVEALVRDGRGTQPAIAGRPLSGPPGRLSVAEYLAAQGGGSSPPISPSGETPRASRLRIGAGEKQIKEPAPFAGFVASSRRYRLGLVRVAQPSA